MIDLQGYNFEKLRESAKNPIWIDSDDALQEHCARWRKLPLVVMDTEFVRTTTYWAHPGLIQVADQEGSYLIDPSAIRIWYPLKKLMTSEDVIKVLHSPSEDLELFIRLLNVKPVRIYDTQIAAALVGWGLTMSLQKLIKRAIDVDLDKGETRSDWLQRPLTDSQKLYAAYDVVYLAEVVQILDRELEKLGRLEWMEEESVAQLNAIADDDTAIREYYRRFTQLSHFDNVQIAGLRELCIWREKTARIMDMPRNRLMSNDVLQDLIVHWPRNKSQLAKIKGITKYVMIHHDQQILRCTLQAAALARMEPPKPIDYPIPPRLKPYTKAARALGAQVAEEQNILPDLLIRKRDIDAVIRSKKLTGFYELPATLMGWRRPLVGDKLIEIFNEMDETSKC